MTTVTVSQGKHLRRLTELSDATAYAGKYFQNVIIQEVLLVFVSQLLSAGIGCQLEEFNQVNDIGKCRVRIMATKRKSGNKSNGSMGEWHGIVRVPFTAEDKEGFDKWMSTVDVADMIQELVSGDYKLTLSYDNRNDAYLCSISCYDASSPNYKHTMISRAASTLTVLHLAIYKHFVVANGEWHSDEPEDIMF